MVKLSYFDMYSYFSYFFTIEGNDDLINMLHHNDDDLKKLIDSAGGEKFYTDTFK